MNKAFTSQTDEWTEAIATVQQRYDREYRNEAFDLPAEVESMPLFREWVSHTLAGKIASPFGFYAQLLIGLEFLTNFAMYQKQEEEGVLGRGAHDVRGHATVDGA